MINIYYIDGVQPGTWVRTCNTIREAKKWVNKQLKGYTMVDDDHPCTDDVIASSRTAKFMVFDGGPITTDEDGELTFAEPIYTSDYFYTE